MGVIKGDTVQTMAHMLFHRSAVLLLASRMQHLSTTHQAEGHGDDDSCHK